MSHKRKADHWESSNGSGDSAAKRGRKEDHLSQSSSGGPALSAAGVANLQGQLDSKTLRVSLQLAASGRRVCLPGSSTAANGWTVPAHCLVQNVTAPQQLLHLERQPNGSYAICRDDEGEAVFTQPVSGVLTPAGDIADPKCPLLHCAKEGVVQVLIGEEIVPFAVSCADVPCADVDGISTPSTP